MRLIICSQCRLLLLHSQPFQCFLFVQILKCCKYKVGFLNEVVCIRKMFIQDVYTAGYENLYSDTLLVTFPLDLNCEKCSIISGYGFQGIIFQNCCKVFCLQNLYELFDAGSKIQITVRSIYTSKCRINFYSSQEEPSQLRNLLKMLMTKFRH